MKTFNLLWSFFDGLVSQVMYSYNLIEKSASSSIMNFQSILLLRLKLSPLITPEKKNVTFRFRAVRIIA
ncbi:hypothetical protein NC99_03340 [Sunxiuqinia dokdonensis]|uniref:Uncharacterized protein n=1 Tax=Sunxiuqinia dokdonensis TaxID=1409788 RepID=A0A0L8VEP5_9BACT|nr:hypothetical protein NC99_03340 [Sunxiuqinia dokdonensis]